MASVEVVENGRGKYQVDISVGPHAMIADEPVESGGNDCGPQPHDFLLAGLGACTSMTLRMYAERKGFALEQVKVHLTRRKDGAVEEMTREITLIGDLDDGTRQKLLEIANKCPVHKTLTGEIKILTALTPT